MCGMDLDIHYVVDFISITSVIQDHVILTPSFPCDTETTSPDCVFACVNIDC